MSSCSLRFPLSTSTLPSISFLLPPSSSSFIPYLHSLFPPPAAGWPELTQETWLVWRARP